MKIGWRSSRGRLILKTRRCGGASYGKWRFRQNYTWFSGGFLGFPSHQKMCSTIVKCVPAAPLCVWYQRLMEALSPWVFHGTLCLGSCGWGLDEALDGDNRSKSYCNVHYHMINLITRLVVTMWAIWTAPRKAILEGNFQIPIDTHEFDSWYISELEGLKDLQITRPTVDT